MTRTIFGKILLSHIAVILISTITLGVLTSYLVQNHLLKSKRHDLLTQGSAAVGIINPIMAEGRKPADDLLNRMSDMTGGMMWLMDRDGSVIAGQPPQHWSEQQIESLAELWDMADWSTGGGTQVILRPRKRGNTAIIVALPVQSANSSTALFLYSPIIGVKRNALVIEQLLLYSLIAGVLATVVIGYFLSRSITRPIGDISRTAVRFAKGDYTSRTNATSQDEIGRLGQTFNSMAEELARAEHNRRDFLSNVSHELKTPVASIQALAETILDGLATHPEQRQRYLESIVGETRRISRLINDLLELSQLDAGELSVIRQQLNLGAALTREADKIGPFLTKRELQLILNLPSQEIYAWADPDRFSQVMSNLLTNAVRYASPATPLTISLSQIGNKAEISVSNQGPGISPSDLPRIWERFYRVEKSRTRADGGTGLGLAITKKLVEAMNGEVSAESIPNQTTTFRFTLPTEK